MKLAILGTRGVPPEYGGFETFAAELATRLVSRGHDITVYSRVRHLSRRDEGGGMRDEEAAIDRHPSSLIPHPSIEKWRGVTRIVLPAMSHKYLETVSHTFLSALDVLRRDFDAVLVCNAANAFVLPLLRAARFPAAINVDGIERKRRKWNLAGRAWYAVGESFSVLFASRVVADAKVIADYYRSRYGLDPLTIPYGAEFPIETDSDVLARLRLEPRRYILYVSRFEPENNPLDVVLAYERLARTSDPGSVPPLVMVGEGLYAHQLVAELRRHESELVRFPGALYGADYRTLQRHAAIYIQATEVGGTHPALIEAMASGGYVLANDTPENREVGGDAVRYFQLQPEESLSGTLRECLAATVDDEEIRERARRRAAALYSWDRVTDSYERLFREIGR